MRRVIKTQIMLICILKFYIGIYHSEPPNSRCYVDPQPLNNPKRIKFSSFLSFNHFIHHISQILVGLKAVGLSTYICATLIALLKT